MIARLPVHRAVARFGEASNSSVVSAPTPEQLRDKRGRIDGVRNVAPAVWMRWQRMKIARIQRLCGVRIDTSAKPSGLCKPVRLYPLAGGKPLDYPSIRAAAADLGIGEGNIAAILRRKKGVCAGYRWVKLNTRRKSVETAA